MSCLLTNKNAYSNLECFEIRLRVFLKNSGFFLKKGQKLILVRRRLKFGLLMAYQWIPMLCFSVLRVFLINSGYFFEKSQELILVRLFLGAKI
jgi:hypothetical protein